VGGILHPGAVARSEPVLPMGRVNLDLVEAVGAKMATLGEMQNRLGLPVPDGFVVTAWGCHRHFQACGLDQEIGRQAQRLARHETTVDVVASELQERVRQCPVHRDVARAIRAEARASNGTLYAVRSSALGEDTEHSFAGQHETLLNVPAQGAVDAWREVVASLFSSEALRYRQEVGVPIEGALMAVGFLAMVPARASGVLHTVDPGDPERDVMVVSAAPGLGPSVMQGGRPVDRFELSREPRSRVLRRAPNRKDLLLAARDGGGVEEVPLDESSREAPCVPDEALVELAGMALRIERHAGQHQEIEWAWDESGQVRILQARGLRISLSPAQERAQARELARVLASRPVLLRDTGVIACRGVGAGAVVAVHSTEDLDEFPAEGVLVARDASPRYAPALSRASAVITTLGSSTGHLAAVARELRVPMLVDVRGALEALAEGQEVTVDAEENVVYDGIVEELVRFHLSNPPEDIEFEEFRLLRRLLRAVAPLNLHDPEAEGFRAASCTTYHDVVRFAHEMGVRELVDMPGLRPRDRRRFVRRLDLAIPLDLDVLDLGGGGSLGTGGSRVPPDEIRSAPLAALLEGLTAPGTWRTEPVDMDMESLLASATRFASPEAANAGPVRPNLAVVTGEYMNLHLMLGYHFNLVDCHMSETASENYIYFRFLGGVTDITRRSRRARMLGLILQEFDFAVETKGDLVIARLRGVEAGPIGERLEMIGRLIGYSRQIDVLMRDDGAVLARAREFVGKEPRGLDAPPRARRPRECEGEGRSPNGRDAGHGGRRRARSSATA